MQPTGQPSTNPTEAFTTFAMVDVIVQMHGINKMEFDVAGEEVLRNIFSSLLEHVKPADVVLKSTRSVDNSQNPSESDQLEVVVEVGVYLGKFDFELEDGVNAREAYDNTEKVYEKIKNMISHIFQSIDGNLSSFIQALRQEAYKFPHSQAITITAPEFSISNHDIFLIHSPQPSSMPTSMPTCPEGNFMDIDGKSRVVGYSTNCAPCLPGFYQDKKGNHRNIFPITLITYNRNSIQKLV